MLSLKSVTYRYAGSARPSLHDVTLELADGEVVGLVGANEAGKSTLCLVASGLAPRTIRGTLSGTMSLDGQDVSSWPMHRILELVGVGFQNPATQLSGVSGTVYEEVSFGLMNLGVPRQELAIRTSEAMAAMRIEQLADRDPAHLSGGQMQLVAIAGLLAMHPKHLVLDEPTAQLDPAGTELVADALAGLAERGASILIAEHKTDLIARICRRAVCLDAGRIVLDGPTRVVMSDPRLTDLGVAEPSLVRLRRVGAESGVAPARIPDLAA
jgi:energy-coupling factor transport system ATP-binding protein